MGKWVHRLYNINPADRTAECTNCGDVDVRLANGGRAFVCQVAYEETRRSETPKPRFIPGRSEEVKPVRKIPRRTYADELRGWV